MLRMGNKLLRQFLVLMRFRNGAASKATSLLLQILYQRRNGGLRWRRGVCSGDDKMCVERHVGNAKVGPIVATDDKICAKKLGVISTRRRSLSSSHSYGETASIWRRLTIVEPFHGYLQSTKAISCK